MIERLGYACEACSRTYDIVLGRFRCDCGGVLDLVGELGSPTEMSTTTAETLLRYEAAIPVQEVFLRRASLGSSTTPLLKLGGGLHVKCDYLLPSGSFKDRGAQVLVALALELGARRLLVDSSGNAGASVAAHGAWVGLPCTVVAPASAPQGKLGQSLRYGAEVIAVEGGRSAAGERALELASEKGTFYASHVESPFFLEGTKGWAFEVWEQLGDAPLEVIMAVGNGSLFIGAHRGFKALYGAGLTTRMPKMIAVQAAGWSPIGGDVEPGAPPPLADGIAIAVPRRLAQIQSVIDESGGGVVIVDDVAAGDGTRDLMRRGIWVEPTAGAAWAGRVHRPIGEGPVVVNLGGAGFKAPLP